MVFLTEDVEQMLTVTYFQWYISAVGFLNNKNLALILNRGTCGIASSVMSCDLPFFMHSFVYDMPSPIHHCFFYFYYFLLFFIIFIIMELLFSLLINIM